MRRPAVGGAECRRDLQAFNAVNGNVGISAGNWVLIPGNIQGNGEFP